MQNEGSQEANNNGDICQTEQYLAADTHPLLTGPGRFLCASSFMLLQGAGAYPHTKGLF